VTQVAVGAMRIIAGPLMIPIANYTRGKDQERNERQGNPEYSNGPLQSVFGRSVADCDLH